jgi:dihydroorotate dehydrogenase electron transfer subunit
VTDGHDQRDAAAGGGPPASEGSFRVTHVRHFGRYALLTVDAPPIAGAARAGPFVMVGVPGPAFHLRRPISIHSVAGDALRLLIEPKGDGSRALCATVVADTLDVAGPIGTGFPTPSRPALLLGGGIGVAPLQFLGDSLRAGGATVTVAFGFRDAAQARLVAAFDLEPLWVATEDGSVGRRGTVVDVARTLDLPSGTVVYACGPTPMLAATAAWAAETRREAYGSLEAHMGCGSGQCQGCVVATDAGYRRVCVDGPVFPLAALEGLS